MTLRERNQYLIEQLHTHQQKLKDVMKIIPEKKTAEQSHNNTDDDEYDDRRNAFKLNADVTSNKSSLHKKGNGCNPEKLSTQRRVHYEDDEVSEIPRTKPPQPTDPPSSIIEVVANRDEQHERDSSLSLSTCELDKDQFPYLSQHTAWNMSEKRRAATAKGDARLCTDISLFDQDDGYFKQIQAYRERHRSQCMADVPIERQIEEFSIEKDNLNRKEKTEIKKRKKTTSSEKKREVPLSREARRKEPKSYFLDNRMFPVSLKEPLAIPGYESESKELDDSFVRISVPMSFIESSSDPPFKPHRRSSWEPDDTIGLRSHCVKGFEYPFHTPASPVKCRPYGLKAASTAALPFTETFKPYNGDRPIHISESEKGGTLLSKRVSGRLNNKINKMVENTLKKYAHENHVFEESSNIPPMTALS